MHSATNTATGIPTDQGSICRYLERTGVAKESRLFQDSLQFEQLLANCTAARLEEAVPAEMMQMFTDAQWSMLLFEFQPSMQLFSSAYDIPQLGRQIENNRQPAVPGAGKGCRWIIFADSDGVLIRSASILEYAALGLCMERRQFAEVAETLWPEIEPEASHQKLTEVLLGWLDEGLVIDAGVPIPEGARFEQEQEQ
jgi:hypothetical protein